MKRLEDFAFELCSQLDEVNIENGLEYIGFKTFDLCESLKTIRIPNSVNTIDSTAFWRCSLDSIVVDNIENSISDAPWGCGCENVQWLRTE